MSSKIDDKQLDQQCIKFLELLAELEVKKQELENHMKNGFFHLAKARYALGVNRISKLSYPNEMKSIIAVDCNDIIDERFSLYKPKPDEHISDNDEIDGIIKEELRKRHTGTPDQDIIGSGITEEKPKPKIAVTDPIRWFSALAPQSLRSAQQSFSQALRESCEICNLQTHIEEVQIQYKNAQLTKD